VGATLRYGVIGAGMMGCEHIRNVTLIDGAEIVALADPVDRSLDWGEEAAGRALLRFADHREMLQEADLDAVIIASPNHTHAAVLDAVFETDVHVLCEKPLCTTFEDCRETVRRAESHKGVFWVGMEYRYMPPVAHFIEEVKGGAAGTLKMFAVREHRFPFLKKVGDWNRFNRNSGGTLVEKSCHFFDLMRHVIGAEPVRVFASGAQDVNHLNETYDGEMPDILDNAYVTVEFENGVRAMHDLCMFAEGSANQEELVAVGDTGKLECQIPTNFIYRGTRRPMAVERRHVGVPHEALAAGTHEGATYFQHRAFHDAIADGAPPDVTAQDGLRAVAMGLAAHRSIAERRVVEMSEFGL